MNKIYIFILFLIIFSTAKAQSFTDRLVSFLSPTETYSVCSETGATQAVCTTAKPGLYVYYAEYGGRGTNATNVLFYDNKLEHTLPAGWYEGKTAQLDPRLFSASNFDTSLVLFGVTGFPLASGPALSECTYGTLSTPAPLTTRCKMTASNYFYPAPDTYGARTNECATPGATTTMNTNKCWLKVGSGTYLASPSILPECKVSVTTDGLVSQDCTAPKSLIGDVESYYYNNPYNGKSAICNSSVGGAANVTSCYVPSDKNYFKVTNACSINAANSLACDVPSGNYPYTDVYGGRGAACDSVSVTSNCWFASANKSSGIGSNLIDTNIRTGINIFGIVGTYDGNPTEWGTGAPKNNGTIKGTYKDESFCGLDMKWSKVSGCGANTAHRWVPVVATDHEGENSSYFVDRTTWGTTECGLTGVVDTRISDCVAKINTALSNASVVGNSRNTSTWNANGSMGNSGFGPWKLVSRVNATSGVGIVEVWRDENTKLYWSSRVSANVNWCRAAGSSNNPKFPDLAENDPANICNQQTNQQQDSNLSIISACYEDTGFSDNHSDITQFTHGTVTSGKASGKAGIHSTSTQKMFWRLPTIYDYRIANYNGMRFVLPDMSGANTNEEWTATVYSLDRAKAWTFQSASGQKMYKNRGLKLAARCIGRGF